MLDDTKFLVPLFLALAISCSISLRYKAPIGYDYNFHLEIARVWSRGQLGMMSALPMTVNKMPYPPLLHLILVPSVWLQTELEYAAILQVLFYPLAVAAVMQIFWKKNRMASLISGVLVMGSYAFFDRSVQVAPQALDMILLPLAFYFSLKQKSRWFILVSVLMIYNHGFVSLACLGGLFIWELKKKRSKNVYRILLLSLPIILPCAWFLGVGLVHMTGGAETLQETQFWLNPLWFSISYQRLLFLGFPLAIYLLVTQKLFHHRKLEDLEKMALLTIGSMMIMIPSWADRFLQYSTIPLTILLVHLIMRSKQSHKELWHYAALFAFIIFYATLWMWLFVDVYYVRTL